MMTFREMLAMAREQLFPLEVQASLPPLYATEHQKADDKTAAVKFFTPWTSWTWYVIEGSPVDADGLVEEVHGEHTADYLFFCLVDGGERELGYVSLSELVNIAGPFGLRIERDEMWMPKYLGEL